jgi:hypothetical protein
VPRHGKGAQVLKIFTRLERCDGYGELKTDMTHVPLTMNDSDDQKERERRNVTETGFPPMNNASAANGLIWKWESSAKLNWILVVAQTVGIFRNPKKNIINNKRGSQRVYLGFFGWYLANVP